MADLPTVENILDDNIFGLDNEIENDILSDADIDGGSESDIEDNLTAVGRIRRESNPVLPETCTVLTNDDGCKIYLVGTAHFSHSSQEDVRQVIRATQPDFVLLELCRARVDVLNLDEETLLKEAKDISFTKARRAIRESGFVQGILHILLLSLSAHVTKQLGMAPGGEFRTAYKEALLISNCQVQLADRPVQITLRRAFALLSPFQKLKLVWHILTTRDAISVEDVEKFKEGNMLEQLLKEMTGDFPSLGQVFVEERDKYLAYTLRKAMRYVPDPEQPSDVDSQAPDLIPSVCVGVVGIGHIRGIVNNWEKPIELTPLLIIPPPSLSSRLISRGARIAFYLTLFYVSFRLIRWQFPTAVERIVISLQGFLTHLYR